jgi:hypothetical protein
VDERELAIQKCIGVCTDHIARVMEIIDETIPVIREVEERRLSALMSRQSESDLDLEMVLDQKDNELRRDLRLALLLPFISDRRTLVRPDPTYVPGHPP